MANEQISGALQPAAFNLRPLLLLLGIAGAVAAGVAGVDLAQVMLETQKASVSFRALAEVRNRLVNVYQEIMNMPI